MDVERSERWGVSLKRFALKIARDSLLFSFPVSFYIFFFLFLRSSRNKRQSRNAGSPGQKLTRIYGRMKSTLDGVGTLASQRPSSAIKALRDFRGSL